MAPTPDDNGFRFDEAPTDWLRPPDPVIFCLLETPSCWFYPLLSLVVFPELGYNIELFWFFICFDLCGLDIIWESTEAPPAFWTMKFLPRERLAMLLFLVELRFYWLIQFWLLIWEPPAKSCKFGLCEESPRGSNLFSFMVVFLFVLKPVDRGCCPLCGGWPPCQALYWFWSLRFELFRLFWSLFLPNFCIIWSLLLPICFSRCEIWLV